MSGQSVTRWLNEIRMPGLIPVFEEHDIDWEALLLLSSNQEFAKELVPKVGTRLRVLNELKKLRGKSEADIDKSEAELNKSLDLDESQEEEHKKTEIEADPNETVMVARKETKHVDDLEEQEDSNNAKNDRRILPKGTQLTIESLLSRQKGVDIQDPYAELRRIGFKVYDKKFIQSHAPMKQKWYSFWNEEGLKLARQGTKKAQMEGLIKNKWSYAGGKAAACIDMCKAIEEKYAESLSDSVIFLAYKQTNENKSNELKRLQLEKQGTEEELYSRIKDNTISCSDKISKRQHIKRIEQDIKVLEAEYSKNLTNWSAFLQRIEKNGIQKKKRGRKRKTDNSEYRSARELKSKKAKILTIDETEDDSNTENEADNADDGKHNTSENGDISNVEEHENEADNADDGRHYTYENGDISNVEEQQNEADNADDGRHNTYENGDISNTEEHENEADNSDGKQDSALHENDISNMEKHNTDTSDSDNEVDASVSEKTVDNSGIESNVTHNEKEDNSHNEFGTSNQFIKSLGFCQNSILGGIRGSSACTGICLMMLQNFWKTSDQTLNMDDIIPDYKKVMRKAVVTWNEEMLQEMDVGNAMEYLEMDEVDLQETFWHTELKVGGITPYQACLHKFTEAVKSKEKNGIVFTLPPNKTFVILSDIKGHMCLLDSHVRISNEGDTFEEALKNPKNIGLCLTSDNIDSVLEFVFGDLAHQLGCKVTTGVMHVLRCKYDSKNL